MSQRDRNVLLAFIAEAILAGGNPVAIRFSNRELAPIWGASLRFLFAAAIMIIIMAALRLEFPRGKALVGALLFGLFQFSGAFGLYYFALVYVHAGFGQTFLALVPLAALLLAVAQGQEKLLGSAIAGTILALAGVALISRDPLRGTIPWFTLLALIGSVLCFGEALVLARRIPPIHPVALNAAGMLSGSAVLVGASVLADEALVLPQAPATWLALGYVSTIGSVVVFLLVVYIVQRWTASRASYAMVLIPFVTVLLSAWLDKEPITSSLLVGGLLILAGVYVGALRTARLLPKHVEGATAQ